MSTGTYRERAYYQRPGYDERDMLMKDRFYPGEFAGVVLLAIASLLVWTAAVYGLTHDPKPHAAKTASIAQTGPANSAY